MTVTMAHVIYRAVVDDAALQELLGTAGKPIRFYARGTLGREGVPANPETPYAMYGESGVAPAHAVHESAPNTGLSTQTFYVYDRPGSYERIKSVHRELRRVVEALSGTTHEEGMIVTEALWIASGADQYDPVSKNNIKTQTFRTVGRV